MRILPRVKASPAFTAEVMRKLRREETPAPVFWRAAVAFAMAVVFVGIGHLAFTEHSQRQQTAELRLEQQKLEAELETVKRLANESEAVLVLEDTRGTRVIMDLDSAIQPASHKTFD